MIRDALSILLVAALVVARPRPGEYSAKESYAKGGGSLEGGYKFTDDVILPSGSGDDGTNVGYGKSAEDLDIPHINLEEHQTSMENEKALRTWTFHTSTWKSTKHQWRMKRQRLDLASTTSVPKTLAKRSLPRWKRLLSTP